MTTKYRFIYSLFLIFGIPLGILMSSNSWAQEEPVLRVARISYLQGTATMERTADEDWVEATLNTPLMEGDKLYSGQGARVEIQLEDEVVIRMDGESFIHFERLDQAWTQVRIVQGTVAIHARPIDYQRPWIEVNTAFSTTRIPDYAKVCYRVQEEGLVEAQVQRGAIEFVIEPQKILRVGRDEMLIVKTPGTYLTVPSKELTEFDHWCDFRDAMNSTSRSSKYVTNRVSGYNDLDRYGDWVAVADYGQVWHPRITLVDWAPYRHGRWQYRHSCGWVWISNEPWGWVPYHYGRWVHVSRHGWCWVPGDLTVVRRPVWSPALVGFIYSDHGSSLQISIGSQPWVGWFPLGPADPYWGWFGYQYHHRRNYNNNHHDRYQNIHVANAVSVIPREDFGLNRYERIQRSTLKQSDSSSVVVGGQAIQDLNQTLFERPDIRQNRLQAAPAPRLAAVRKDEGFSKGNIPARPGSVPSSNRPAPESNLRESPGPSERAPISRSPDSNPKIPMENRPVSSRPSSPSSPSVRTEPSSSVDSRVTYIGMQPESRSNSRPETESRSYRPSNPEPRSNDRPESRSPSSSQPQPETRSYSRPEPQIQSYSQPKPEPRSYSRPKPQIQSYSQPKLETRSYSRPEPQIQSYSQPKPETRSYSRPEPQIQSYSQPKLESSSYQQSSPRSYSPPAVSQQGPSSNRSPASSSSSAPRSAPQTSTRRRGH